MIGNFCQIFPTLVYLMLSRSTKYTRVGIFGKNCRLISDPEETVNTGSHAFVYHTCQLLPLYLGKCKSDFSTMSCTKN